MKIKYFSTNVIPDPNNVIPVSSNVIPAKAGIHKGFCWAGALRSCQLILLFLALMFASCAETSEDRATDLPDSTEVAIMRPDQQIRDARISLYDGPNRTTDVYADYIEKYEKLDSTQAKKLNVYFFDNEGKQISNLVADSGIVREQVNFMEVFGNFVVTTEDSSILYT